ncbi:hypothetical protein [Alteromonas sp. 009811495]|uniref:hypothetical protein n=1 Tax=Alteromonas sp. 009811495 TaxID=3002962 RepID=UPI00237DBFC7|nr:hypothetical protein [Alteromonas sp. 009811495]WDT84606.1 hypothetical protein OZ660_11720 [Alteromonas sp. 009811495]
MYQPINQTENCSVLTVTQAHKCVTAGNILLAVNLVIFLGCIVLAYGVEEYFSLFYQVLAHMLTIISAGFFKVGYVVRCIGMHSLGKETF